MKNNQFFALVGPPGAGKSTLLEMLRNALPSKACVFLSDSSGCGNEYVPHARFTKRVTEIARDGVHTCTTPRSQLLLFWSRLQAIIECTVQPELAKGKIVIMDGFGGTILAHALHGARTAAEEAALTDLHKSMIGHCVIGLGVKPPTYLLLKPSPEVAHDRLASLDKLPDHPEPLMFIERMNAGFEFYSRLPGQTVESIDADQSTDQILECAMAIIRPQENTIKAVA